MVIGLGSCFKGSSQLDPHHILAQETASMLSSPTHQPDTLRKACSVCILGGLRPQRTMGGAEVEDSSDDICQSMASSAHLILECAMANSPRWICHSFMKDIQRLQNRFRSEACSRCLLQTMQMKRLWNSLFTANLPLLLPQLDEGCGMHAQCAPDCAVRIGQTSTRPCTVHSQRGSCTFGTPSQTFSSQVTG